MTRISKKHTNLLCIDAGYDRKIDFDKSLPRGVSMTQAITQYMDSVIEENRKKDEAHINPINVSFKPNSLDIYIHDSLNNFLHIDPLERSKYLKSVSDSRFTEIRVKTVELRNQLDFVHKERQRGLVISK